MPSTSTATVDPALQEAIMSRVQKIPVFEALGIRIEGFAPGECVAVVPRDKRFDGIFESFHGGMLMTAADTIACFAVMTLIGADDTMATTDMNIRFLAPCLSDVTVKARVIKAGKTMCPVHVDLLDAKGKLVAVAQVNYIRISGPIGPRA